MFEWFQNRKSFEKTQRILQKTDRKTNKNRNAGKRKKHTHFPKVLLKNKEPFVVYADFESIIKNTKETIPEDKTKPSTIKTQIHEACGFAYVIVRSDGWFYQPKVYRGANAVEEFMKKLTEEEKWIREYLKEKANERPKTEKADWEKFKQEKNYLLCEKPLLKQNFMEKLPVWEHDGTKSKYKGLSHKYCLNQAMKNQEEEGKMYWLKKTETPETKQKDCVLQTKPFKNKLLGRVHFSR